MLVGPALRRCAPRGHGEVRDAVTVCPFTSHAVVQAGSARVTLAGELDWDTAPYVRNAVAACLAERPTSLRLDLTDLSFCDCAGLGALLEVRTSALRAGVDLVAEGIGTALARLLDLTGTGEVLTEGGPTTGTEPSPPPLPLPSGGVPTRRDADADADAATVAQSPLRDLLA
ncbi:STAS domain-containing protein [Streptomyces sp. NPDC058674]|uniref:STAS domain-containing protein n=1 Tax=Streptomyces sp. NPDC058674 TaxID=3346592 RepID=UPI003657CC88